MAEHTFSLVEVIEIITRKIAAAESQAVQQSDFAELSFRQIYYLETIAALKQPTPSQLAETLDLSKPTVSVAVDKLVALGYLQKVESREDKRSFHLHLTQRGKRLARRHAQVHQQIVDLLTANLNAAQVQQLTALLNKALQSFNL